MDMDHVKKAKHFESLSDEVADAYYSFKDSVEESEPFDEKTKELLALAASIGQQCSYCIDAHSRKAKKAGATEEEIAKVVQLAAVVGAGARISYGVEALDVPEE